MSKIDTFEDLHAWQESRELVKIVYGITRSSDFSRDFGLRDQIQRAAISVMSNIAEGFERGSNKEFIQFLYIAKGSAGEVRSQLYAALDLGYIDKATFETATNQVVDLSRRIAAFINYLNQSSLRGAKRK
jgi:four helix bundle protein